MRLFDIGDRFARRPALAAWCAVCALAACGDGFGQQAQPGLNENVVFLDAAHGGSDPGAHLGGSGGGSVEEKDVTLRMGVRLRAALAAKGFSVVSSRDGDQTVAAEQRAGVANHARPLACILLHASASGSGAVLAASALNPDTEQKIALPWATAQAAYVSQSLALREAMAGALSAGKIKMVAVRASTPPIDSLTCAAVTVEVGGSGANDEGYQAKIVDGIAGAMVAWKAQVAPPKVPAPAAAAGAAKQPSPNGAGK